MTEQGETGATTPSGSAASGQTGRHRPPIGKPSAPLDNPPPAGPSLKKTTPSAPAADAPLSTHPVGPPGQPPVPETPAGPDSAGPDSAGPDSAGPDSADALAAAPPSETRRQRRKRKKADKPHRKAPWWELPALVALAIVIAIVVKTFVVQPFYIPSDSMEKTLHGCPGCHGDRILVNKPIYDLRDPHPGDVVVFHAPPGWDDEPTSKPSTNPLVRTIRGFGQLVGFVPPDGQILVKRVIATGGQTVKGTAAGDVMVSSDGPNGHFRTLQEPFVYAPADERARLVDFGPVTVPKGRLWVMGDHRTDSADSRYHCGVGGTNTTDYTDCDPKGSTVPVDDVIGKAFVIAWPPSRWRTLGTPSTFESAATAAGPALPSAVSMATVLPILFIRRGRRRNRAR